MSTTLFHQSFLGALNQRLAEMETLDTDPDTVIFSGTPHLPRPLEE